MDQTLLQHLQSLLVRGSTFHPNDTSNKIELGCDPAVAGQTLKRLEAEGKRLASRLFKLLVFTST